MRQPRSHGRRPFARQTLSLLISGLTAVVAVGCASPPGENGASSLQAGHDALRAGQYERAEQIAERTLSAGSTGPLAAEAYYLRGRSFDARPAPSPHESRANWQSARISYERALRAGPDRPTEAFVRTALANVAYVQQDYETALDEWQQAEALLDAKTQQSLRAWATYRSAVCLQRLGRFAEADRVLRRVTHEHPGTIPAQRAGERVGLRDFNVRIGAFRDSTRAERVVTELRRDGLRATKRSNAHGLYIVSIGPLASYSQAEQVKLRCAYRFPDAYVTP